MLRGVGEMENENKKSWRNEAIIGLVILVFVGVFVFLMPGRNCECSAPMVTGAVILAMPPLENSSTPAVFNGSVNASEPWEALLYMESPLQVRLTLDWNGSDDLDLVVKSPSGKTTYESRVLHPEVIVLNDEAFDGHEGGTYKIDVIGTKVLNQSVDFELLSEVVPRGGVVDTSKGRWGIIDGWRK